MHWNHWIRQAHRWLSIAFTLAVLINGVAVYRGHYSQSLGLVAVLPLALLFLTGAYLFVLPHFASVGAPRSARGSAIPEVLYPEAGTFKST